MPTQVIATATTVPSPGPTSDGTLVLPLDGWSEVAGDGTWTVIPVDGEAQGPVLVTAPSVDPPTDFGIGYPSTRSLEAALSILSFTLRSNAPVTLEVVVSTTEGGPRVLAYEASDGTPTVHKRRAEFPLGAAMAAGVFRTTTRDLAMDVQSAFGTTFAAVEQVRVFGALAVSRIALGAAGGVLGVTAAHAQSLSLPLDGWGRQGTGQVLENEDDPALHAPTLCSLPADPENPDLRLFYPRGMNTSLIGDFRTFTMLVRDEEKLSIEFRVRTTTGRRMRLRYEQRVETPVVHRRGAVLPIPLTPIGTGGYSVAVLSLAEDLALIGPDVRLGGVLRIRLEGGFRAGALVFEDPLE